MTHYREWNGASTLDTYMCICFLMAKEGRAVILPAWQHKALKTSTLVNRQKEHGLLWPSLGGCMALQSQNFIGKRDTSLSASKGRDIHPTSHEKSIKEFVA